MSSASPKATNIVWHQASVDRDARAEQRGHRSAILWFTGLSGAGKSTLARGLAKVLGSEPVLEPFADNPFLEQFYLDPERYAFPVELSWMATTSAMVSAATLASRTQTGRRTSVASVKLPSSFWTLA